MFLTTLLGSCVIGSEPVDAPLDFAALGDAFRDAQIVNLAKSANPTVVTLRDVVKIPPPAEPVFVKTFRRDRLPVVLQPVFRKPGICGVTIGGRYIVIIQTEFPKEHEDILRHELVHAYITLASPKPLPLWFQEGSAVHFSTDKDWKFYGKPSDNQIGVMVGRKVDLDDYYKNKLHNFHYLIDRAGKPKFYKWYRNAVMTGVVNARPLLGLTSSPKRIPFRKPVPVWAICLAAVVIITISIASYYAMRRERDIW